MIHLYLDRNAENILQIQAELEDAATIEGLESGPLKSWLIRRRRKAKGIARKLERMYTSV